jgi:hypothetical protein
VGEFTAGGLSNNELQTLLNVADYFQPMQEMLADAFGALPADVRLSLLDDNPNVASLLESSSFGGPILDNLIAGLPRTGIVEDIAYSRFDTALAFMYDEMITNANSNTVSYINALLEQAENPAPLGENSGNPVLVALEMWALKVRPGGEWDHKPILDEMLGLGRDGDYYFPFRGNDNQEFYYDIWSNVHFGYVGSAAGFDAETLQQGAQAFDGIAGRTDDFDVLTVQIGIDLWNEYGTSLTPEILQQEILTRIEAYVQANPNTTQVIDQTNGR